MKPYELPLSDILYTDADRAAFAAALHAWQPEYSGRFIVLDQDSRYRKLLIEYQTDWCAAELWIYGKDGQAFPDQIALGSVELDALAAWSVHSPIMGTSTQVQRGCAGGPPNPPG